MRNVCKWLAFGGVGVLVIYMAAMTVLEKFSETAAALKWGYHSPVFIALWGLVAVCGLAYLFGVLRGGRASWGEASASRGGVQSGASASRGGAWGDIIGRCSVVGLHVAFVLILVGALVTHLSGKQGAFHLRVGDSASEYLVNETDSSAFPFTVTLEDFRIIYYPGTSAPADYESTLLISPSYDSVCKNASFAHQEVPQDCSVCKNGSFAHKVSVSMNKVGKIHGWRFYQSSYDEDGVERLWR